LASEFAAHEVVAIDAQSFAEHLLDRLGWAVPPDDVEDFIGPEFRFGPLELFLSCEADVPCVMAERGAHVALIGVATGEGTPEVTLRLDRTGGQDAALWRGFEFVTLQRSAGEWRVVGRRVVGGAEPSNRSTSRALDHCAPDFPERPLAHTSGLEVEVGAVARCDGAGLDWEIVQFDMRYDLGRVYVR
jgi:hypothetical protein